jgi:hypothetical protein
MSKKLLYPKLPHKFAYSTLAALYASNCLGLREQIFYALVALVYVGLSFD